MDFRRHLQKLIESVRIALEKDRHGLVLDFRELLAVAASLLQTDSFDFWRHQIGSIAIAELPITRFGVFEARRIVESLEPRDRRAVEASLIRICHLVFTYCSEDDLCPMQTEFHYFVDTRTGALVKESEMGRVEPRGMSFDSLGMRIATISDLAKDVDEFIAA